MGRRFQECEKVNVLPRTSVDILRVPQGVKRPRRKTIGLSLNQTIGAIAQDRQTGGSVAFDFNCRSTFRWKAEKAKEKEEAGDRSLQTQIVPQRQGYVLVVGTAGCEVNMF